MTVSECLHCFLALFAASRCRLKEPVPNKVSVIDVSRLPTFLVSSRFLCNGVSCVLLSCLFIPNDVAQFVVCASVGVMASRGHLLLSTTPYCH